jgi:MFS transporter, CP family, cyanate transporter
LAQMFRDAGFSPESAGLLLAGVTAVSVPIALVMPTLATRLTSLRPLVLGTALASALSYAGLLWLPHEGALVWMVLLALGQGTFPMALAMIGLRARTSAGIVSLSAFTQSVGYLIAALGPLSIGLLYELSGGWAMPIGLLLAALLVQTGAGWAIARPRWIEDEAGHP